MRFHASVEQTADPEERNACKAYSSQHKKRSSSRGSNASSKGPEKRKSKEDKNANKDSKSPKATPAAVCLIAAILASAAQAMPYSIPCCPSVRKEVCFYLEADVFMSVAHGGMEPYINGPRQKGKTYPPDLKSRDMTCRRVYRMHILQPACRAEP